MERRPVGGSQPGLDLDRQIQEVDQTVEGIPDAELVLVLVLVRLRKIHITELLLDVKLRRWSSSFRGSQRQTGRF